MGPAQNGNKRVHSYVFKIEGEGEKNKEIDLQNEANELCLKAERNPGDKRVLNELFATNLRLEKLLQYKTKGAIL